MTVPAIAPASDSHAFPLWIRIVLIGFALVDMLAGLVDLPNLLQDDALGATPLTLAQVGNGLRLAVTPLIAGLALYFAIVGRARHAIVAMGIMILIWWLSALPAVAIDGLKISADIAGLVLALHGIVYPLIAIAAIVLAVKNRLLGLATLLVCVPATVAWLHVLAFLFGASIDAS